MYVRRCQVLLLGGFVALSQGGSEWYVGIVGKASMGCVSIQLVLADRVRRDHRLGLHRPGWGRNQRVSRRLDLFGIRLPLSRLSAPAVLHW